jgi:3',5'-cyclic-AMP phosphodiesterase
MHHNPDPFVVGLRDTAQLMDIVVPRRQVKAVMYGHTHVYNIWQKEGLHFINLPAAAYRLNPNASLGWVLATMKRNGMHLQFNQIEPDTPPIDDEMLSWRTDA